MKHDITITEAERQILLNGLAWLAAERPTWIRKTIVPLAQKLHGIPVLDAFLALRRDQLARTPDA